MSDGIVEDWLNDAEREIARLKQENAQLKREIQKWEVRCSAHRALGLTDMADLQAENARLREALVELTLSGEWLAFGNLPDEDREPKPIAEALAFAHSALEVKP